MQVGSRVDVAYKLNGVDQVSRGTLVAKNDQAGTGVVDINGLIVPVKLIDLTEKVVQTVSAIDPSLNAAERFKNAPLAPGLQPLLPPA